MKTPRSTKRSRAFAEAAENSALACGERHSDQRRAAEQKINANQQADGLWGEAPYTGGGFPRVFYLRYHGYSKFFPLWALARYRNLMRGNEQRVAYGM